MLNSKIRISKNMSGMVYIKSGETEIQIDIPSLTFEEKRGLINGIANILQDIACYMYKPDKE